MRQSEIIKAGLATKRDLRVWQGTWAGKPAANTVPLYACARITDYGANGFSDWYSNGTRWLRDPLVIYSDGDIGVSTTSATETALLTVAIKGGSLGPNGKVELRYFENHANSSNARGIRLRIGVGAFSTSQSLIFTHNLTTTTQSGAFCGFQNQSSVSSQISTSVDFSFGTGSTTGTTPTAAVNTDADFNLFFGVLCVGGVDSFTLKGAELTIRPAA